MKLGLFLLSGALLFAADKTPAHYNIPLWEPGKTPLAKGDGPLDAPFLTVFQPPAGKANGSSVIIAPGGSNIMLMYSMEGMEVAERYNEWGATAFVLTYRLSPRYNHEARTLDGKRAVQLVRSRAAEFKIDPRKIGLIGFSAGSELVRYTTANASAGDPNASDPLERVSSRPDYIGLVYSAGRPSPGEQLKDFPPSFFCTSQFDRGPAFASAQLFSELTKAGAVAEMHIYQKGRHGFGTGYRDPDAGTWMEALRNFLVQGEFLPAGRDSGAAKLLPAAPAANTKLPAATAGKEVDDGYGALVLVPAGSFRMGDNFGDGEARERPVHQVHLDSFYIGKYEVTNGQWRRFRDDPGYDDPQFWPNGRPVPKDQIPYWSDPRNHGGGTPDSDNYPVLGVNWDAAVAYCNWLSAKTGRKYRLPTEAEWEKAARGTDGRKFPWGNTIDLSNANFVGTARFDTGKPVGSYKDASPYGAHDMAGNVLEWCSDWYSGDYYSVSPAKNPKGPEKGAYKVLRGGSFFEPAFRQRSYSRSAAWPSFQAYRMVGFRVARDVQ